ncbi:MAG: orotidine-5'-phosphate decarboxylase [Phycisphaerales bacterium]|nr:orotidine-5'-phosphate decarboxylase [Planctomycetota bacterium]MBL6997575.1 orotidine-5'-phosphate decarboxylase [Phycisphaerales bacterium]
MMHDMKCSEHPADRMCETIDRIGVPLCVGIDPVFDRLPMELQSQSPTEAFKIFCIGIIDAVKSHVVSVKFQSACFEREGAHGVALLGRLREYAHEHGLQVILDAKRGDIGISASHYAAAVTADGPCDWVTVNPYLGADGIEPFLDAGLGVFCLVRTSNPSGDCIQQQVLCDGRTVAESIADILHGLGEKYIGESGWSALGAVVGATKPDEALVLRERMPHGMFLMPGIGAQGATPEMVSKCFADGHGALATASRSVIYPQGTNDWQENISLAAKQLASELEINGVV